MKPRFRLLALACATSLSCCIGEDPGSKTEHPDAGSPDAPDVPVTSTLVLGKDGSWIHQGEKIDVPFTVTGVVSGTWRVRARKLPAGVVATDVDASAGAIAIQADANVPAGISADLDVELVVGERVADAKPFRLRIAGPAGDLDTTWGVSGVRTLSIRNPENPAVPGSSYANAIAVYPKSAGPNAGKVVIGGGVHSNDDLSGTRRIFVARFDEDSTPDTTFGEPTATGHAAYRILDIDAQLEEVAIDSLGRIVVLASTGTEVRITRLTATGEPDSSFVSFAGRLPGGVYAGRGRGLLVLPGDKILVGGYWNQYDGGGDPTCAAQNHCGVHPVLAVFNADGTRDTTFGTNGAKTLPAVRGPGTSTRLERMLRDAQGRIVFVGSACDNDYRPPDTNCKSFVARATATGDLDPSFGDGPPGAKSGFTEITFGGDPTRLESFFGVSLDTQGRIVAAGWSRDKTRGTIARFSPADGSLDASFASTGSQVVDLGGTDQSLVDVLHDENGRILAVGGSDDGTWAIHRLRFDAMGTRDTAFAPTKLRLDRFTGKLALTADQQMLVAFGAERAGNGPPYDVAVSRFWP